jgi:hypothetical protein
LRWVVPGGVEVVSELADLDGTRPWSGDPGGKRPQQRKGDPKDAELLVLADANGMRWVRRATNSRTVIGDAHWYSAVEVETYASISALYTSESQWREIDAVSRRLLGDLQAHFADAERVAVFGTGPSMTSFEPETADVDAVIACNSAVSNPDWLGDVRPTVFVFADPVFHFGPSRYAVQFRSDLRRYAERSGAVFVAPRRFVPLLLRRMPVLQGRLIGVDHRRGDPLDQLGPDNLVVPQTSNVLTLLMLPFALALGNEVLVAGCDGRRPSERYFWAHSGDLQYEDDLMCSAFEAHPSFFRDRDYVAYYKNHCVQLESLLSRAERNGARFRTVTPSEIPALAKRATP